MLHSLKPVGVYVGLLAGYIRPLWPRALLLTGLLALALALQLVHPQIARYFVDTAQQGGGVGPLYMAGVLFLVVGVVYMVVLAASRYVGADLGWRATNRLRSDLVLHVLRLDLTFHHAHPPGELLERIDGDVERLANFFAHLTVHLLFGMLLILGVTVVVWVEDWRLGLGVLAFVTVNLVLHTYGQRMSAPRWLASRKSSADVSSYIGERIDGIKDIQTSGAGAHEIERFGRLIKAEFTATFRAELFSDTAGGMSDLAFVTGLSAVVGLGAYLVVGDVISAGTMLMVILYVLRLRGDIQMVSRQVDDLNRASASVERVRDMLDVQPSIRDDGRAALPGGPLSVELDDVRFAYHGSNWVLEDVSFDLLPGRTLGLLGRTGSGKTTISRLIFRLYEAQRGAVLVGGVDIREAGLDALRGRMGMVTQDVQLFRGTLRDNVTLFDETIRDSTVLDALGELGLAPWIESLEDGLDTHMGVGGAQLSAGEAQLVAMARVFLKDPDLVILDEASSRLDPATDGAVSQAVWKLLEGRTGIIIAHRLATVRRVDDILIIEGGRVQEHGERAALEGRRRVAIQADAPLGPPRGLGMSTWRFILRLIASNPALFAGAVALAIGANTVPLLGGLVLRDVFDAFTGEAEMGSGIWGLVALFTAAQVASVVVERGYWLMDSWMDISFWSFIRGNLFRSIMGRPPAVDRPGTGDIINRFVTDVAEAAQPIYILSGFLGVFVGFGVALYVMASINLPLTLFTLAPVLLVVLVTRFMRGVLPGDPAGCPRSERGRYRVRHGDAGRGAGDPSGGNTAPGGEGAWTFSRTGGGASTSTRPCSTP